MPRVHKQSSRRRRVHRDRHPMHQRDDCSVASISASDLSQVSSDSIGDFDYETVMAECTAVSSNRSIGSSSRSTGSSRTFGSSSRTFGSISSSQTFSFIEHFLEDARIEIKHASRERKQRAILSTVAFAAGLLLCVACLGPIVRKMQSLTGKEAPPSINLPRRTTSFDVAKVSPHGVSQKPAAAKKYLQKSQVAENGHQSSSSIPKSKQNVRGPKQQSHIKNGKPRALKPRPRPRPKTSPKTQKGGRHLRAADIYSMFVGSNLQHLATNSDPIQTDGSEIPLFWEISGTGHLLRNVLSCREATIASNDGNIPGKIDLPLLHVVNTNNGFFVNVDTFSIAGLERAKNLGLASSDLANVIISPLLHHALVMFDSSNHMARAFAMIRHPLERLIDTYLTLQANQDPSTLGMSLKDYALSPLVEDDWMVRTLSGKYEGEVTSDHFNIAKQVLRSHFIVGLYEDRYGSIARFERYFGWEYTNTKQLDCHQAAIKQEKRRVDTAKQIIAAQNSEDIVLLSSKNQYDIQLYDFAGVLYREQTTIFHNSGSSASQS